MLPVAGCQSFRIQQLMDIGVTFQLAVNLS